MCAASLRQDLTLRALEARDVPGLSAQLAEFVPGHWSATGRDDAQAPAHQFRVLTRRGAHGAEELVGIAEYQRIVDEGHLLGIAVAEAQQRQGLGLCLLQAVMAEMRNAGCVRCLLEVRRSNVAGQALYTRAGFMLDGVRKNYYPAQAAGQPPEDALLYSCPLLPA